MISRTKELIPSFIRSVTNSYAQVFFSHNQVFAVILLLVSFFDLYAGISGILAVLISNAMAFAMGFNRFNIKAGYYGFNSLLVGLGVGVFFQPTVEFYVFLVFVAILTTFITVALEGVIGKYGLPYLSIPFLFGIWMVTLASREFSSLQISERGIYTLNEMYMLGGLGMLRLYEWFNDLAIHESIKIYFRSLGAIFFQYHMFAGILIAIGLLIYSRIALVLSLIGFYTAYYFYHFIGADLSELSYSYIGFNYILSAIAVGGFFIIPGRHSILWVILLTPLISITITSTAAFFSIFQLSIFSLPFNIIVLLFLYVLKFRERSLKFPELVAVQQFTPEKNLYVQRNYHQRFHDMQHVSVHLPFWGEWKVTQAHHGDITHKDDWQHAWDFEIYDDEDSKFKNTGTSPEDYYAYNKPLIAPADGVVQEIADGIEDNKIGDMNLSRNWGNSVVIKHTPKIYSQLSHIKAGSFKISKGDFVKKGDIIAYCGNSGRSPEPHVHFQLQETPHVGSATLNHPVANYLVKKNARYELRTFDYPQKDEVICNIQANDTLKEALHFVPGQQFKFEINKQETKETQTAEWIVEADMMNNVYIRCCDSGAKAYLKSEGNIHYFTNYTGRKKTLLYYFYLAAYKVPLGFYKDLQVVDVLPVSAMHQKFLTIVQDFAAPFFVFLKPHYQLKFDKITEDIGGSSIRLSSALDIHAGGKSIERISFGLFFEENIISRITVREKERQFEAKRIK